MLEELNPLYLTYVDVVGGKILSCYSGDSFLVLENKDENVMKFANLIKLILKIDIILFNCILSCSLHYAKI